jgi:hypothetical protein
MGQMNGFARNAVIAVLETALLCPRLKRFARCGGREMNEIPALKTGYHRLSRRCELGLYRNARYSSAQGVNQRRGKRVVAF